MASTTRRKNRFLKKTETELQKNLKIKTKVCQRYAKERVCYEKEIAQHEAKIKAMTEEGRDSHDIQQRKSVLAESVAMIPEVEKLYKKAVADLAKFLENAGANEEISASPFLKDAQLIIQQNDTTS